MAHLSLGDLTFRAAVCSEDNIDGMGSEVSGLRMINADRMMWFEAHPDRRTMSFQLDPDTWLLLSFGREPDFKTACDRMEALT